jgi:hypothetical protein
MKRYVVKFMVMDSGHTMWYVRDTILGYNTSPVPTEREAERLARDLNKREKRP